MPLDVLRAFEKDGLRTALPSTHSYCFVVLQHTQRVAVVGATRRASSTKIERHRRYWIFDNIIGDDGAWLIVSDAQVPNLHPCKDQLKLESLLMGNRAAVRSFLNEEAVALTRGSTFMTEVLPVIVELDIMPAVPRWTRDDITAVFRRSKSLEEAAQIAREQIKLLVVSGDLHFDEAVVLTSPSPIKSAPKKRRAGREGIVAENLLGEGESRRREAHGHGRREGVPRLRGAELGPRRLEPLRSSPRCFRLYIMCEEACPIND
jgi:hypothetical protein